MNDTRLEGRVALVTGGAARLGAAIASTLHGAGTHVVIHYRRSAEAAAELSARLNDLRPGSASLVDGDLVDPEVQRTLVSRVLDAQGHLDVLVNNASSYYPTPMGTATQAQWDDLFGTNARAPFFLSQAAAPALKETRGCIVNLVDIHAERPNPHHPVYAMAKAANVAMVKSLAQELAPDVRVNGIAPGAALWPENYMDDAEKRAVLARIPLGRPAGAQEIADAVLFMVAGTGYITGQVLAVDGGRTTQQ